MFGKRQQKAAVEGCDLPKQTVNPSTETIWSRAAVLDPNLDSPLTDDSDLDDTYRFFDPSIFAVHILNIMDDERPHTNVTILNQEYSGLLDSGSSVTVMRWSERLALASLTLKDTQIHLKVANGDFLAVLGYTMMKITYKNRTFSLPVIMVRECAQELILGYDCWRKAGLQIIDAGVRRSHPSTM